MLRRSRNTRDLSSIVSCQENSTWRTCLFQESCHQAKWQLPSPSSGSRCPLGLDCVRSGDSGLRRRAALVFRVPWPLKWLGLLMRVMWCKCLVAVPLVMESLPENGLWICDNARTRKHNTLPETQQTNPRLATTERVGPSGQTL